MTILAPYPNPEARDQELVELLAASTIERVDYGLSVEGRPLVALRFPSEKRAGAPKMLCCANIHGPEFIGNRVAVALIRALAHPVGPAAQLRARAEVWVAPCLNPDGYSRTWEAGGRGELAQLRTNARGVDLNRNFPLPAGESRGRWPGAGSSRKGDATYFGDRALSEPETASLAALLDRERFLAAVNLHSFMGSLISPRVPDREAFSAYGTLCRAFARAQTHSRYSRLASRTFDSYTGEQEDHQHHAHGTWATCVEVFPWTASLRQHLRAPSLFWRFNPRTPQLWIDNDLPGVIAYFLTALELAKRAR